MASPNIVDGEIRNTEPATGQPLPPVRVTPPGDVAKAVERARRAQRRWAELDWRERKRRLLRFRDVLNERADEMVDVILHETGKARFEALTHEVVALIDLTHYFATRAERILQDRPVRHHLLWPIKRSYIRYEPRGVIGIISPWNFPLTLAMGDVIMALSARNAVVVKPSEWTPLTMLKAQELLAASGIDPDLVAIVPGDGETGAELVRSEIDMIVFTGSVATGRKVAAACGERLIPCVAELGGKDVAIVLPDADVEQAARWVTVGAFLNTGQACASIERVLVHESIFEPFVDEIVKLAKSLRQGNPNASRNEHIDVGGVIVPSQMDIVVRHVEDARQKGATILTGGHARHENGGRFFAPTVMVDVTDDMLCWKEETFGPTLPIRSYSDIDEAVAIANDTDYGLNAYVFSRSVGRAEDVANRLEAGGVIVNDMFFHHGAPEAPWGGWKNSGLGRVHGGPDGLHALSETRFVGLPRVNANLPVDFPYDDRKYAFFDRLIRRLLRGFPSRFL